MAVIHQHLTADHKPFTMNQEKIMETELLLADTRGQYIPQDFANLFADQFSYEGTSYGWPYGDAISTLLEGPESEWYWDAWMAVLEGAKYTQNPDMSLYQDGDLFLLSPEDLKKFTEE
jgi:hypothetical protein